MRSKTRVEWDRELARSRAKLTAPVRCGWRRGLWERNRQKWIGSENLREGDDEEE